jgi:dipeptidyl aminopeptidase/acylaminoacyl peptidase
MNLPLIYHQLFGGYPWDKSHIYLTESPIYQLHKARTPTHIVTGEKDVRVDATQSYMLERGLYYLGIPVKLIILPTKGHEVENNPWHGKIKVREELKWLEKYGHQSWIRSKK